MLRIYKVSLLLITSPGDTFGFIDQMGEATLDGERIANVVNIDLVCEKCREEGPPASDNCNCISYLRPPHLSKEKDRMIKALYGSDQSRYDKEIQGLSSTNSDQLFPSDKCRDLIDKNNNVILTEKPKNIYLTMDLPGFGRSCLTAIGVVICQYVRVVVYIGSFETKRRGTEIMDEYTQNLVSIFATIRNNAFLRDANIIVCPEAMPPTAPETLHMFLTNKHLTAGIDMRNVIVVMEGNAARDKLGCHKTKESTREMFIRTGLLVKLMRVRFWDECLGGTNSTFQIGQYQTMEQARLRFLQENLVQQMEAIKDNPTSFSEKFTEQNDSVVAFTMIGYWPDLLADLQEYYQYNLRADFEREAAITAVHKEHFAPIFRVGEDNTIIKQNYKQAKTNL